MSGTARKSYASVVYRLCPWLPIMRRESESLHSLQSRVVAYELHAKFKCAGRQDGKAMVCKTMHAGVRFSPGAPHRAGLVKWYHCRLPFCRHGFDSHIPLHIALAVGLIVPEGKSQGHKSSAAERKVHHRGVG